MSLETSQSTPPHALSQSKRISATERQCLNEFKLSLMDKGWEPSKQKRSDDFTLLRFLRARNFDLKKSMIMYSDFLKWRREHNVDSILKTWEFPEIEAVLEIWPQIWHKTDKAGRPVNIHLLGELSVSDLLTCTTEERLLRQAIWVSEELTEVKLRACTNKSKHIVSGVTIILDLNNLSIANMMSSHVRRFVCSMTRVFTNYYPEYLGNLIMINAPATFSYFWEYISPIIDEKTKKKIKIFENNGIDEILNIIDKENYPSFMGGTCECPNGCDVDCAGPWSDEKFVTRSY